MLRNFCSHPSDHPIVRLEEQPSDFFLNKACVSGRCGLFEGMALTRGPVLFDVHLAVGTTELRLSHGAFGRHRRRR